MANVGHVYVTFGGTLTGTEIWQCGIRTIWGGGAGVPSLASLTTYLSDIQSSLSSWYSSAGAVNAAPAKLAWIKAAYIDTNGKYPPTFVPALYTYGTPVSGAAAGTNITGITNIACSFTTDNKRGRAAHGRIYPPNVATPSSAYGVTVATATCTGLVTATKALLNSISNNAGTTPTTPVVVSMGPGASIDDWSPITGVKVGNVIDTQRRRKDDVAEVYSTGTYP